ncbi:unnamed protein product [Camellia sinensis]
MGQRGLSASSCFREEICFSSEKELGFWKPKTMHYYQALRRHPVNCILQAHINQGSLLLGIWYSKLGLCSKQGCLESFLLVLLVLLLLCMCVLITESTLDHGLLLALFEYKEFHELRLDFLNREVAECSS